MTGTCTLDHVQIAMPAGGEAAARAYYGDAIGLVEIPKPAELAGRGGCWFALGTQQLHIGVDADFRPAKKAHVAFSVADLSAVEQRIRAVGGPIRADMPVDGRARFFSDDPFGNRVECIESAGA